MLNLDTFFLFISVYKWLLYSAWALEAHSYKHFFSMLAVYLTGIKPATFWLADNVLGRHFKHISDIFHKNKYSYRLENKSYMDWIAGLESWNLL